MSPRWLHWPAAAPAGPTLVIHDAFGGSGGLSGRTPDTVDNGNTWTTASGNTYSVTSGYVVASSDTTDFSKAAFLSAGQSTYTVSARVESSAAGTQYGGVAVCVADATNGSEDFYKIDVSAGNLRIVSYTAGSGAVVTSTAASLSLSTEYWYDVQVDGSDIYASVLDSTRTSTIASVDTTGVGGFTLAASNNVGLTLVSANFLAHEFKVYT